MEARESTADERRTREGSCELVDRARAGDRDAFDALYRSHVGRVYALCLRISADRRRAEELTQDAFVRCWERLPTFRGDSRFGTWLYRLAANVAIDDRRAAAARRARFGSAAGAGVGGAGGGETAGSAEGGAGAGATEARVDLERAIATLPPGARAVLVLHAIEGYRYEEVAEITGTAVGTVKSQLHRARKLLRERLDR